MFKTLCSIKKLTADHLKASVESADMFLWTIRHRPGGLGGTSEELDLGGRDGNLEAQLAALNLLLAGEPCRLQRWNCSSLGKFCFAEFLWFLLCDRQECGKTGNSSASKMHRRGEAKISSEFKKYNPSIRRHAVRRCSSK